MFKKIIAILILQRESVLTSRVVVLKNSETELWDIFADLLNVFLSGILLPYYQFYGFIKGSLSHLKLITVFLSIFNLNFTRNLITKESQSPNVMPCIYINFWLKGDWEPHVGKNNVFQNVDKHNRLVDHIKKYLFFYFLVWLHVSFFEGICFDSSIWKKC